MKKIVQNLKYFDYTIFIAVLLLASFGVIMVYSSSMAVSIIEYGGKSTDFFKKQLVFVVVGVMILLIVMNIPYQKYSKWIAPIIIFTFTILILVSFVGHTAGNAQSWFKIGGFSIQPAEFAKLATILSF